MRGERLAAGRARVSRLASPRAAVMLGVLVLAFMIAEPLLASLAHQDADVSNGSVPVWFSAAFGVVGLVVAMRKPRNPLGWIILATAGLWALSEDASFYAVADYRLRHGGLPLGWAALLAQPGWAAAIVLTGLIVFLFPEGRLPAPGWRWVLWAYLGVAALWALGTAAVTVGTITGDRIAVDASGNLLLGHPGGVAAWWVSVGALFFPLLALGWVAAVTAQALSWRHASAERRQQLKWLLTGSVVAGACLAISTGHLFGHSQVGRIAADVVFVGILAIPACLGAAILKYRLAARPADPVLMNNTE